MAQCYHKRWKEGNFANFVRTGSRGFGRMPGTLGKIFRDRRAQAC
jgi:hypothetical protein